MEKEKINETVNYCYEDKFALEDVENRRLFLNSEIDETLIESITYHILRYNRLDKDIPVEKRKPIIIYINSPGGNEIDGYGIIDVILTSKTPVYTVNLATCASMALLIYISGSKRYSFKHGVFLLHDGSTMGFDSTAKMRDRIEFETVELGNETKKYILDRTKISENLYEEKYRCEWYFLSQKAKELGITDYIVGEDCSIDEII